MSKLVSESSASWDIQSTFLIISPPFVMRQWSKSGTDHRRFMSVWELSESCYKKNCKCSLYSLNVEPILCCRLVGIGLGLLVLSTGNKCISVYKHFARPLLKHFLSDQPTFPVKQSKYKQRFLIPLLLLWYRFIRSICIQKLSAQNIDFRIDMCYETSV